MEWIAQNWVWILVGLAFVGLHLFGHGGHGGHGGGGGAQDKDAGAAEKPAPRKGQGPHQH